MSSTSAPPAATVITITYAAILAAAGRIVNAIPDVVAAVAGDSDHAGPAAGHRQGSIRASMS